MQDSKKFRPVVPWQIQGRGGGEKRLHSQEKIIHVREVNVKSTENALLVL